jgi:amino acid transporter
MFWTMHSGIIAAIAVVCARYLGFLVELSDLGQKSVAVAIIVILSVVNYFGVKHGSVLQTVITAGKLVAIAAIVVLGFAFGGSTDDDRFTLLPIVCLGACDKAPTMMIDDELIENVTAERLGEIFGRFE